jgi:hypothetical protein
MIVSQKEFNTWLESHPDAVESEIETQGADIYIYKSGGGEAVRIVPKHGDNGGVEIYEIR